MINKWITDLRRCIKNRKKNKYIETLVRNGLVLGQNVQIVDTFFFDPAHCFLISIGDNCIIAPNVHILAHDASTKLYLGYTKIGRVDIGDNCFIGHSSLIQPGVTIGNSCIIGAGSVVTKNIPPKTVAAGIPAKTICSLDEYLRKIREKRSDTTVYSSQYHIANIDESKRKELRESLSLSIGFIE
jgi:maltose O-acetyltransferase